MAAQTADVIVVGGGVVGTGTAFHLARLGAGKVVLCERRFLAAGASGKSGALVRMHYTNEPEARLARFSLDYFKNWADLVGTGDCGFMPVGMLRLVAPESEGKLRVNVEMLRRLGVNTRVVGPEELLELAPDWRFDDVTAAAYEPESGFADPVATTYGFAEAARRLGAQIVTGTEVLDIIVESGRARGVITSRGPISAGAVVVAGGVWAMGLLGRLHIGVKLYPMRVQVAVFRRPPGPRVLHPVCIDGPNEMWLRPEGPGWASTLVGIAQREILSDVDDLAEGVDADYIRAARERASRRVPTLAAAPMRGGWAGAITFTEDGKPIIDRHPEVEGLYFFTGDCGTSFKTSPGVGLGLAEWVVKGRPETVDLRPFRASRFAEGKPIVGEHEYGDRDYDYARLKVILG